MKGLFALLLILISTVTLAQKTQFELLEPKIDSILRLNNVSGAQIVVVSKDSILYKANFGKKRNLNSEITDATLFGVASITKSFTALAILKLVEEGKLSLNDNIRDIVPKVSFENPWENDYPVKVIHLLEHTTGWDKDQPQELAYDRYGKSALEKLNAFPETRVCRYPPGQYMSYTNDGPSVAGYIIEKITGVPYQEYVTQKILIPMGMTQSTFDTDSERLKSNIGISIGDRETYRHIMDLPAGGLFTNATDMAKYLQFYLNKGRIDSLQFIDPMLSNSMFFSESTLMAKKEGKTDFLQFGKGFINYSRNGVEVNMHPGATPGFISEMVILKDYDRAWFLTLPFEKPAVPSSIYSLLFDLFTATKNDEDLHGEQYLKDTSWEGYYRPLTSGYSFTYFIDKIVNISQIKSENGKLYFQGSLNGNAYPLFAKSPNSAFFYSSDGIKYGVFKGKNLLGESVIQLGDTSGNLGPVSAFKVWFNLGLLLLSAIFIVTVQLVMFFRWVFFKIRKKTFSRPGALRMALLANLSLVLLVVFIVSQLPSDLIAASVEVKGNLLDKYGHFSIYSASLFLLSLLFGLFAVFSCIYLFKDFSKIRSKGLKIYVSTVTFALIAATIYLGINGFIGFTFWQ